MKNLVKAIEKELRTKRAEFAKGLKAEKSIDSILSFWYYKDLLTPTTKKKEWASVTELKSYLINRYDKQNAKRLNNALSRVETVSNSQDVEKIVINVEYKKSSVWGWNPRAEAIVYYTNNTIDRFDSGSISGCGYDKQSTAIANVLNQINGILKPLYTEKNRPSRIKKSNREALGYGSGYGIKPSFEGGVGVNCYPPILEKIGYKFEQISNGKTFDVFQIEKL